MEGTLLPSDPLMGPSASGCETTKGVHDCFCLGKTFSVVVYRHRETTQFGGSAQRSLLVRRECGKIHMPEKGNP